MGKRPAGVILYEGPSVLDGAPIVVIATFNSSNVKTGYLIQTWIMRSDIYPIEANKAGADESVCGMCPHRGINGHKRSCYVNLLFGPSRVWHAYRNGSYPVNSKAYQYLFDGRRLRVGSYGDPVAAPIAVWESILPFTHSATSYTHLWRLALAAPFRAWTMASVDTVIDRTEAKELGWRTYRVSGAEGLQPGEVWCPASPAGGDKAQCIMCMACDGNVRGSGRKDFAIPVHGGGAGSFNEWSEAKSMQQQGFIQTEIW